MSIEKRVAIGLPVPHTTPLEAALHVAESQVFPFLKLKILETGKKQTYDATIQVSPSVHKALTQAYAGEEIVIFFDLTSVYAPIGIFSGEMVECIALLTEAKMMSPLSMWLTVAREKLTRALSNQKGEEIEATNSTTETVRKAREMLRAAGLLAEVDANNSIFEIATEIVRSGKRDLDTTIYRLGMAVYWASKYSGQSLIQSLEDPTQMYLKFVSDSEMIKNFKSIVEKMKEKEGEVRQGFVRTLMCFVIGTYLCNKALVGGKEK
ncbi:MAG TPA: hypothetical protein VE862_03115 [Candidatus Acidoferrum sp.]|nr:hypothetical protein [Candidatus Acidoferrum sp.]